MGELQLYFSGKFFMAMEINIPDYDRSMAFKTRVDLRHWYVQSKVEEMKVMYYKQIAKMDRNYEIFLIVKSGIK